MYKLLALILSDIKTDIERIKKYVACSRKQDEN
jgi:hypothetical protein